MSPVDRLGYLVWARLHDQTPLGRQLQLISGQCT